MSQICCGIDLYVLPEGCIAAVISLTSPRDACRLSSVSKMFNSAADSDSVWENFLPSDYLDVLSRSDEGVALYNSLSRKQLFFHLADIPLLIDGGSKTFSLEKSTGKKCYSIAAKDLVITWGDTPRYWTWHSVPESRFSEVGELVTVCWLEICGKLKTSMLSRYTNYSAYFVFRLTEGAYGFHHAAEVMIKTSGGKTETRKVYIDPLEGHNQRYQIVPRRIGIFNRIRTQLTGMQPALEREGDGNLPQQRKDGWMEIEIGQFMTHGVDEDGEVEMVVREVEHGNWKGGLIVEGLEIRPRVITPKVSA